MACLTPGRLISYRRSFHTQTAYLVLPFSSNLLLHPTISCAWWSLSLLLQRITAVAAYTTGISREKELGGDENVEVFEVASAALEPISIGTFPQRTFYLP